MRTVLVAALLAAALPGLTAGPASAQSGGSLTDKIREPPEITTKRDPGAARQGYADAAMARQLEHLIGQRVTNPQGQELGEVEDLLVRPDGKVAGVVVEWGVLAGLSANQVAVPWSQVRVSPDGRKLTVDATKEQLEKLPKYDPDVPANAGVDPDVKPMRR
ncbi:MAG TPA: PRC-barrel domain-containing protein [Azospirillum sp.]|nr:PRC-barrel domain-containing protein [Azospirillum sp.]